jgi:hypothetical protein
MSVTIDHLLRSSTKWKALTTAQRGLLIELWMWIDEQHTDGHIPDFMLTELGVRKRDLDALTTPVAPGKAAWLDRNGTGWMAHDWLEHNPPAELGPERDAWFHRRRQGRYRASKKASGVTANVTEA